jgi:serine/threonine protein kinase
MVTARRRPPETETRTEARTETRTSTANGPIVVDGTMTEKQARDFEEALAASTVDARLWSGAFATNVWGGRYAIEGILGEGAQGTTFMGTDLKTGARIAVKVFDLGRAKDWKAIDLFDREVATLKAVEHPGIPKLLDVIVDEETGARALVRTLIPGDSLKHVVDGEGRLSEGALWNVIVDCADVLGALHSRPSPIVHRDIKPSNLIRRTDGKTCLVDFGGVGRAREAAGSTVVGTFGYMAPEQLYGAQTPATDMYSLGATLLMLATGTEPEDLPRDGLSLDVDKAAPHLSERMRALLKKLTSPDPKQRPQDAQHLLGDLKAIAQDRQPDAWPDPNLGGFDKAADSLNDAPNLFVGIVALVFGVLGVAGAVVVGQIILPLILTIMASMASSPQQRANLNHTKARVREAARLAKGSFEKSALHGAQKLEELGERDYERRKENRKRSKREWKQRERQWKQELKDLKRERKTRW